jgi:hypothetical protein
VLNAAVVLVISSSVIGLVLAQRAASRLRSQVPEAASFRETM